MKYNYGLIDLSEEEYSKLNAFNASSIKLCDKTPYHMDLALKHKFSLDKASFPLGTYFHSYVFEPKKFEEKYYIESKKYDGRKKEDKQAKELEQFFNSGKIAISAKDAATLNYMRDGIYKHPIIKELIDMPGEIEKTLYCHNDEFDIDCKGKVDKLIIDNFILDAKSTKDSSKEAFKRDFIKFGYDIQGAWYVDMYKILYGKNIEYALIAVDKFNYYPVLYEITKETLDEGRKKYEKLLKTYFEYKQNPMMIYRVEKL